MEDGYSNGAKRSASPAADDEHAYDQQTRLDRSSSSSPQSRKDKRRAEQDDEDDEDDEEDDEDDEEDDDDDDDDDDEDEDEDGEDVRGKRRRAKKQKRNRFLDVEAEVDDDEEDLDEEEEELAREDGFIEEDIADDTEDVRRRAAADNQRLDRFRREEEDTNAEALAEELRQRYGRSARYAAQSDYAEVPQRLLMPSVEDPNLWGVPCKPGRERDIVMTLVRKAMAESVTSKPMRIISAFCRDTIPGKIYVEARRADDIITACSGLAGVYARQTTALYLIPISEMADLLKLQKVTQEIQVGGWVRIKRGKYAGDLAQVLDVSENGEEVGLKFIPRIDLNPKDSGVFTDSAGRKRKKGAGAGSTAINFRPPQKFFNPEEVQKAYPKETPSKRGSFWVFQNDSFRDGYLEKDMRVTGIITENVNPTLEEITRFAGESAEDGAYKAGGVDLSLIADAAKKASEVLLQPGDHVEVFEGEQAGVFGVVEAVSSEVVTIKMEHEDLIGQKVEVPARSVRKKFSPGDHIKVMTGKHADETGLVVKVEDNITTFLSDLSLQEVSVFSKDIREAAEVGSGVNVIGGYELHDLVQLDAQTVGVIFKIERESFKVLDQTGQVVSVKPHQISSKKDTTRAFALDHDGNEIRAGDMVKEVAGPFSQMRTGQVLHVYQSMIAFMHNRDYSENGGIFIARARTLEPLAPKSVSAKAKDSRDLSKLNPALASMTGPSAGANAVRVEGVRRQIGRDVYQGKHVAVIKGPYKTFRGIIKETNGNMARIELQSVPKPVTISLDFLVEKDPITGRSSRLGGSGPGGGAGSGGFSQIPNRGGYNAMGSGMGNMSHNPYSSGPSMVGPSAAGGYNPYGGSQPVAAGYGASPSSMGGGGGGGSWGGSYPSSQPVAAGGGGGGWDMPAMGGSKTPAYNPYAGDGGKTPAYNPLADGGKTPAYNPAMDGGRTPAYNPMADGGRTPAYNPYADGGRTPGYLP
ncbi:uncharacterized protein PFL1_00594 [Pseudozyma flocculosa PF-1]|uniref:Transcription elongation factor SPT5 n=1 Tax=Pseudozyma flocculosa TaxID=84751 RepID=A0A5C3ESZ0_9BASI|nr:uncharacterized protein PFL1_00594 [Pseudozyma flocculosa PF-1]EPQ32398.1 hypothetical protein PFL1_00594 [Pseudozyma flocculosa PF-1]SPO34627.1 related to SPT5 - transcription elongation protein [Pseudozyma flocculosa]